MKKLASFFLVFALSAPALALEVPTLTSRVMDEVGILGSAQTQIEQMLAAHERATGQQFALLIIPTLEGDPIEDFSMRVVETWKLGQKDKDNGLLLLIVHEDRKMRFEVGYGLEGSIPDAFAGRLIQNVMAPAFRAGNFGEGITEALQLAMQAGAGEDVDINWEPVNQIDGDNWVNIGVMILILLIFLTGRNSSSGRRSSSGFTSGGGGFSSGGSFGGGGGFSGGGGGFGGGGASGGW